jgi:aarF domain-containing kinase
MDDGRVGLIDFGQVKQISGRNRETLGKVMIALAESEGRSEDYEKIGKLALELGVEINPSAKKEAAPAIALWLFDGSATELPGGYDLGELSPNSPVQELSSFPQDLVLVGRSTILIKGLSSRLGIPWSLANEWAPIARSALGIGRVSASKKDSRVRFQDVWKTLKQWGKGRAAKAVQRLPSPIRTPILSAIVKRQERMEQR